MSLERHRELADKIRRDVSLVDVIERLAPGDWAKKSKPARGEFWRVCPFHAERTPSFHVVDRPGERFFKCFGCDAKGSVIDFIQRMTGERPGPIIRALASEHGLEAFAPDPEKARRLERERERMAAEAQRRDDFIKREAARIWQEAEPDHPLLEGYLAGRLGRVWQPLIDRLGAMPPSLRLHPALPYHEQAGRRVLHEGPAMVARLGRGEFVGIHRIWIDGPRRARFAAPPHAKIDKRFLCPSPFGLPCVLEDPSAEAEIPALVVGEGIETTLGGLGLFAAAGLEPAIGAEAAITGGALWGNALREPGPPARSAATGRALPSRWPDTAPGQQGWMPPKGVGRVVVLGEASSKCPESAARVLERTRRKLGAAGLAVEIRLPSAADGWGSGLDFADIAADEPPPEA